MYLFLHCTARDAPNLFLPDINVVLMSRAYYRTQGPGADPGKGAERGQVRPVVSRGGYKIFHKGRLRPAIRNAGGWGGGGGGGVRFRSDTKNGGGGGGGGGVRRFRSDTKSGRGLFSRRGGGALYERAGCNPPPPLDPPLCKFITFAQAEIV